MTQRKKPAANPIRIDEYDLLWTLVRDKQWSSQDDYLGITITVCKDGPPRRELILKYPFLGVKPNGHWHIPERARVTETIVEDAIRQAMQAGWDPDSRGRAFAFAVEKVSG